LSSQAQPDVTTARQRSTNLIGVRTMLWAARLESAKVYRKLPDLGGASSGAGARPVPVN
jgi:hypothetical protein